MAKSNWSGSAGWETINDPTGKLNGRALIATAGITATNEDYLMQVVGTTLAGTTFSYDNYMVSINYAWSSGAQTAIFSGGILGLIARAGNYSTATGVSLAQDCYVGRLNYQKAKAEIIKRKDGVETVLQEADIPVGANSFGVRHSAQFFCRGTSPNATLQLFIDGALAVNIGDNSTTILTSGNAGLQAGNGTVYVDNFAVRTFGASGGSSYNGAYPEDFYQTPSDSNSFLVARFASDVGVTNTSGYVSSWEDQAGYITVTGGGAYSIGGSSNRPQLVSGALNGLNVIRYDHTKSQFSKGDAETELDINGAGYGDGIAVFFVVRFYKEQIGDQQNVSDVTRIAPMLNYGRSYQFRMKWDIIDDNPDRVMQFDNNSNFPDTASGDPMLAVNTWTILCYTNGGGSTNEALRGFFKDGTQNVASGAGYVPTNADMSDGNLKFYIGRRYFGASDDDYMYGSFDLAEVILANVGSGGLTAEIRQKTEGYLAHKWGITNVLPSDHPYKNSVPTS